MLDNERIFFKAGDTVQLRLDIPHKPIMIVVKKETCLFKHDPSKMEDKKAALVGIRCRWFTSTGKLLEAVFNTKDLELIN